MPCVWISEYPMKTFFTTNNKLFWKYWYIWLWHFNFFVRIQSHNRHWHLFIQPSPQRLSLVGIEIRGRNLGFPQRALRGTVSQAIPQLAYKISFGVNMERTPDNSLNTVLLISTMGGASWESTNPTLRWRRYCLNTRAHKNNNKSSGKERRGTTRELA